MKALTWLFLWMTFSMFNATSVGLSLCHSGCLVCADDKACLACDDGLYLSKGRCYKSCDTMGGFMEQVHEDVQQCNRDSKARQAISMNGSTQLVFGVEAGLLQNHIKLWFRTNVSEAALLYAGSVDNEDFMALELMNGHVEFVFDLGHGPQRIRTVEPSLFPLNDGFWHHIELRRNLEHAVISVDMRVHKYLSFVSRDSPAAALDIDGQVYIGSLPDGVRQSELVQVPFRGCMRNLTFDGIDLEGSRHESLVASQVNPCDMFACDDQADCLNGGHPSCPMSDAPSEHQCTCPHGTSPVSCSVVGGFAAGSYFAHETESQTVNSVRVSFSLEQLPSVSTTLLDVTTGSRKIVILVEEDALVTKISEELSGTTVSRYSGTVQDNEWLTLSMTIEQGLGTISLNGRLLGSFATDYKHDSNLVTTVGIQEGEDDTVVLLFTDLIVNSQDVLQGAYTNTLHFKARDVHWKPQIEELTSSFVPKILRDQSVEERTLLTAILGGHSMIEHHVMSAPHFAQLDVSLKFRSDTSYHAGVLFDISGPNDRLLTRLVPDGVNVVATMGNLSINSTFSHPAPMFRGQEDWHSLRLLVNETSIVTFLDGRPHRLERTFSELPLYLIVGPTFGFSLMEDAGTGFQGMFTDVYFNGLDILQRAMDSTDMVTTASNVIWHTNFKQLVQLSAKSEFQAGIEGRKCVLFFTFKSVGEGHLVTIDGSSWSIQLHLLGGRIRVRFRSKEGIFDRHWWVATGLNDNNWHDIGLSRVGRSVRVGVDGATLEATLPGHLNDVDLRMFSFGHFIDSETDTISSAPAGFVADVVFDGRNLLSEAVSGSLESRYLQ